jgi:hypothetical protein
MEHSEMLPLVFVDALYLHVEERLRFDSDACTFGDERGEPSLVGNLYGAPLPLKLRVVGERF